MADDCSNNSIIEGIVKFRDGKKWKSRWCVMRKLSPVADSVHLQLYKDEKHKKAQTKSSLSLQHYIGYESGFTLDKESNTLAILCDDVVPVLAFDTREVMMQWRVKVQHNLGSSREYGALMISAPSSSGVRPGAVRLHSRATRLAISSGRPPDLVIIWDVKLLRRYGMVDGKFCVEGGSRCGKGAGLFILAVEKGHELSDLLSKESANQSGSRLSIASRCGSVMEKRLSESVSCSGDLCCQTPMRSISPTWHIPSSHTHNCLSDIDRGFNSSNTDVHATIRRPNSLSRCTSCLSRINNHLTRSSTMPITPGSVMSHAWIMDNISEKRSESDRTSMYSRSSGSASDYSIPRSTCVADKSFERSSPIPCCSPTVPAKNTCQCWQKCNCGKKKLFVGPFENYDVPKPPMPLIQEHPVEVHVNPTENYDTPKRIAKCLRQDNNSSPCGCQTTAAEKEIKNELVIIEDDTNDVKNDEDVPSDPNYVNIEPNKSNTQQIEVTNYANMDLTSTLECFGSSVDILRSAGFSQEEIDALEDIPEQDDDDLTTTSSAIHPSTNCCPDHLNYINMDGADFSSSTSNKAYSDNISRVSHISDPLNSSVDSVCTVNRKRSSSAEFEGLTEEFNNVIQFQSHKNVSLALNGLRKVCNNECLHDDSGDLVKVTEQKSFKKPDITSKSESSFVAKLRESVRIRRSSSAPSKTEKNRDSSSSNDSGVSTGSLKHHKGDFIDFEMPVTNSKLCKKHTKPKKYYRTTLSPSHVVNYPKSNSTDPLQNLTFRFEEVSTLTKSNCYETETLKRRHKSKESESRVSVRDSQVTSHSTSSGTSDMSDYMESLSLSSFSSTDGLTSRQSKRPRSGNEYLSIDRKILVNSCDSNSNNV